MTKTTAIIFAAFGSLISVNAADTVINGAGASFPAPVYQHWTYSYGQTADVRVNYQSLGSGAGINQIRAKTVDFAGTDNPLTAEEQQKEGLVQFPMLTGGVVPIVNLPGVAANQLQLDGATLSGIYLGKIKNWSDPAIVALNPDLKLPKMKITVVRRADASGTSFIFTNYLCKVSPEWAKTVDSGATVQWPAGIGGQKNPGVCNNVAKIKGSIGYTEYTYAVEAKLATVKLKNAAGKFVSPDMESFSASAANADWKNTPGFYLVLTEQPGDATWPITGVTYILMRKDCPTAMRGELIRYFSWCFDDGAAAARKLNYVPLPTSVVEIIKEKVFQ